MHHAHIDKFAYQDSPLHQIDARVKFIVTIIFTAIVISLPRTSFTILFCFAVWPFALLVIAQIPLRFVLKQILIISPFVLVLALTSPIYDKTPVSVLFGPFNFTISQGWLRCCAITGKFIVTMSALIALVSTTRFNDLLTAMRKLGLPKLLTIQLGFLYRYIFVLIDQAHHILQARSARTLRRLSLKSELRIAAAMLGSLFIRSIDTAEKINIAMQARGFDGNWRTISRLKITTPDYIFAFIFSCFMIILYFFVKPGLQ